MTPFFGVPGWAIHLARRVLYFWVRTTVLPEHPVELGLDPSKPVCYVLQHPHFSNLLVLFRESRLAGLPSAETPFRLGSDDFPRSVFFLNRKQMHSAESGEAYAHSPLMTAVVNETLADAGFDVQIVPVVILWGRNPGKQESILKALFAEAWQQPGYLRRLVTILLHGRNVLVRFNVPLSLHALFRNGLDETQALHKLSRVLREHFRRQRLMTIGPDLSHRHTQVGTLLDSAPVRSAIAAEAAEKHIPLDEAQLRARDFALEIASDYSYGVLRALELSLTWLWARLYDGIELHNTDVVAQIAPNHGIVYIPTHRSHIDYLLLSYFLHRQGLAPPHIAAGANLNIPLVGPLLRRAGAFFIRRSFKGEPLYAAVFHEYLHLMLTRGFPIEYFIEGGRSRDGRMLTPKAGILGMTIRSFIREHARPLVFVPVYIGYEKLVEGESYLREMAGKPKQSESLWSLLKSLRRIKRIFGKAYVNFGEPLALADFLDAYRPGWSKEAATDSDDWAREATHITATELARRMNEAAVINPVNLIALVLLPTPVLPTDEQSLGRLLEHFQSLIADAPYSRATVPCTLDAEQIVAYVERLGIVEHIPHPQGDLIRLVEDESSLLAYFSNNVLHLFTLPALIACLMSHNKPLGMQQIIDAVAGIYGLLEKELFLRWTIDEIPAAAKTVIGVLLKRGLLLRDEAGQLAAPDQGTRECAELRAIGETIRPLLDCNFLTLSLLQQGGSGRRTRRSLENDCHRLARRLILRYETSAPEYSNKTGFSTLIDQLVDANLLREDEAGHLLPDRHIATLLAHAMPFIPPETRRVIEGMACADPEVLR